MTEALDYDTIFEPAPIFLKNFAIGSLGGIAGTAKRRPVTPSVAPSVTL